MTEIETVGPIILDMAKRIAELERQVAALVAIVEALRKLADERVEGAWS